MPQQVCLEQLEKFHKLTESAGSSFLDVGTGTGVLCLAAHYFGYSQIVGTDIDSDSWDSVEVNKALNQIDFELVRASLQAITLSLIPSSRTSYRLLSQILYLILRGFWLLGAGFFYLDLTSPMRILLCRLLRATVSGLSTDKV